ncbi:MAG: AEC family transporter [Bacillota bacterium]
MAFLNTLQTVGILLAMGIPGFIIAKLKLIDTKSAIKALSVILLYICQPFIAANAFLNTSFDKTILINLVMVIVITIVLMVALLYIGKAVFFKDKLTPKRDVFSFAGSLGNVGYMCIPFLQLLTNNDHEVILYATASIVGFNLVAWTLGCFFITKNKKHISIKHIFLNLPTISFIIILPFFILNLNFNTVPQLAPLADMTRLFSEMMAPVSMTILGIQFSQMKFRELIDDYRVYVMSFIKLIVSPALAFFLWWLVNLMVDIEAVRMNIIALAAMPSATLVMMFCSIYDSDSLSAAKAVLVSSILSVITIPLALFAFV